MESDERGDSTTCYHIIQPFLTGQRAIIIHRDLKEVGDSLTKLFGAIDWEVLEHMRYNLRQADGWHIEYPEINDLLPDIWTFCRDEPYDAERADLLKSQVLNNTWLIDEVRKRFAIQ